MTEYIELVKNNLNVSFIFLFECQLYFKHIAIRITNKL